MSLNPIQNTSISFNQACCEVESLIKVLKYNGIIFNQKYINFSRLRCTVNLYFVVAFHPCSQWIWVEFMWYWLKPSEQQLILAGLDVGTARVGGSHGGRLWRSVSVCFSVALGFLVWACSGCSVGKAARRGCWMRQSPPSAVYNFWISPLVIFTYSYVTP